LRAEPNSKNQHYVWQYYLSAWATEGTFWCYRHKDRKLFATQPKSVASETYFYESRPLTAADWEFLEAFIGRATDERLRELNRDYVKLTQLSFDLRKRLEKSVLPPDVRRALEDQLRWAEKNLGERYHAGIENKCQDILGWLRSEDDGFYEDVTRCGDFLYFLSLQYFRTAKMREGTVNLPPVVPGHDPRRTASILNHIHATNVSVGLFREGELYRIVFLSNGTGVPLITGDQPVLNMLNPATTDDVELYYPLSPKLALVLTKDIVRFPHKQRRLSQLEVENYNYAIFSKSNDQVYSNDRAYLNSLVVIGKHLLSA